MSKRTLIVTGLLLVGLGLGAWRYLAPPPQATSPKDTKEDALTEAVGLALKGIELAQGEKGIEMWRLKATWAAVKQEQGRIDVDAPDVTYRVGDNADTPLRMVSKKGEITDNQRFLRMWEDVVGTYQDDTLHAPLMTYNATSRIMVFPDGANLKGASFSGNATRLSWSMADNIIRGEEGVSAIFESTRLPGKGNAKATQQPAPAKPKSNPAPQKSSTQAKPATKNSSGTPGAKVAQ